MAKCGQLGDKRAHTDSTRGLNVCWVVSDVSAVGLGCPEAARSTAGHLNSVPTPSQPVASHSHQNVENRVTTGQEHQKSKKSERSVHIVKLAVSLDTGTGF